jgi:hypothetical protein
VKGSGRSLRSGTTPALNAAKENHNSKISDIQLSGSTAKPGSCRYKAEDTNLLFVSSDGEIIFNCIKGTL